MATETITLTIRGREYSHTVDTDAVDVMLAAFMSRHPPKPTPEGEDPPEHPDEANFAYRLRKYTEAETKAFAADQDRQLTPNQDAIANFLTD